MQEAHVLAMLILGLCSFAIGSIPLKLARIAEDSSFISLTLCFGGGVILSTAVVHMLAESMEALPHVASFLFCGGFLILYFIDEVMNLCIGNYDSVIDENKIVTKRKTSISSSSDEIENGEYVSLKTSTSYGTLLKLPRSKRSSMTNSDIKTNRYFTPNTDLSKYFNEKGESSPKSITYTKPSMRFTQDSYEGDVDTESNDINSDGDRDERDKLGLVEVEEKEEKRSNSRSGLIGLLSALLIHSLLEGCSIGVQKKSSEVFLVLIAVAIHKFVLAFCMGLELVNAGYEGLRFIFVIAAFSVGCPIGIYIGMYAVNVTSELYATENIIEALAAGSLLFVALFEVLPRERYKWQRRTTFKFMGLLQMISACLGFTVMTLADILTRGFHSHGPDKKIIQN